MSIYDAQTTGDVPREPRRPRVYCSTCGRAIYPDERYFIVGDNTYCEECRELSQKGWEPKR